MKDKGLYPETKQGNADIKGKGVIKTLMKNMRKRYKWVFKKKVNFIKKSLKITENSALSRTQEQLGKTIEREYGNSGDLRDYLV